MFEPRPNEQPYAFVPDAPHPAANRYGTPIETVPPGHALRGESLNINGDGAVSANPNRYKQHGFYFNADNCIACHACEAACSEKNDLPAHIAFRSVGYVEGGAWPAYQRLNISMACNHCDDPVCLKGCPTRAYTKFAEYGAVLQDPDICFGCGYCTWVCPYNAPQLDTKAGHVSKCNMCVDRLEVGLKPACVAACLAGALDFGIIETTPAHRDQLQTRIPGFPTPEITHPNIRFQQTKSLPRELTRPDSMPLRYERDEPSTGGGYRPRVAAGSNERAWNFKKLRTREDPLVVFTLVSQAVIGAFLTLFLGPLCGVTTLDAGEPPGRHAAAALRAHRSADPGAGALHPAPRPPAPLLPRLQQPALLAGQPRGGRHRRVLQFPRRLYPADRPAHAVHLAAARRDRPARAGDRLGRRRLRRGRALFHAPHLPHPGPPLLEPLAGTDRVLRQHAGAGTAAHRAGARRSSTPCRACRGRRPQARSPR